METLEQTIMQVERFIRKVAQKFPAPESDDETSQMTDIHVRVSQDSGELLAFDDDDNEITRCVVEQWIENKDEDFYDEVAKLLRDVLRKQADIIDHLISAFSSHTALCSKMRIKSILASSILLTMIQSS